MTCQRHWMFHILCLSCWLLLFHSQVIAAMDQQADQTLKRGNGSEPQSLDPHKSEGVPSSNIQRDLYEGLISEKANGELTAGVAEKWEIRQNGLQYTFHLRHNARWSNGDKVTAHDFVYSWRRIVDPGTASNYAQTLAPVKNAEAIIQGKLPAEKLSVKALDDVTLQVELKGPTPYFLGLLTHSSTYPLHRATLEKHAENFTRPGKLVSNGAYMLDDWVVQSHIRIKRNPYYWDNANTRIEYIEYLPIDDVASELKRYRAGEIDISESIPISQLAWLQQNYAEELHVTPYLGVYYYGLNLTRAPFKDQPKLRQALSMVIDREILLDKVLKSGDLPAYSWVPPKVNDYTPVEYAWKSWPKAKRIAQARQLYQQAGYSKENPLQVEIRYNTSENHKKIAIVIAAMWKQHLGVKTTLFNEEWKVFLANRKAQKNTQVFRAGWIADYNDAYSFAELLGSKHGVNDIGYNNPKYDQLLSQSATLSDIAERRKTLQQAESILLNDYPVIPIYYYTSKRLVKSDVGGYEDNIMDHHYSKHLYFKRR